jgi:arylsulfatase
VHGRWFHDPAHLIDVMPTCIEVAEAEYPTVRDDISITPLPGVSLTPSLSGASLRRPTPLFWEHEGNRAIRDGRWKLVAKGPTGSWELYDLVADRTETIDLAADHANRVKSMSAQWEAWARNTQVKPWPWNGN